MLSLIVYSALIQVLLKDFWFTLTPNYFDIGLFTVHTITFYFIMNGLPFLTGYKITSILEIIRKLNLLNLKLRLEVRNATSLFYKIRWYYFCWHNLFQCVILGFKTVVNFPAVFVERLLNLFQLFRLYSCFQFQTVADENQLTFLKQIANSLESFTISGRRMESILTCLTDLKDLNSCLSETYGLHVLIYFLIYLAHAFVNSFVVLISSVYNNSPIEMSCSEVIFASFIICVSCVMPSLIKHQVIY